MLGHQVIAPNESELTFISGVETKNGDGVVTYPLVADAVTVLKAKFAEAGAPSSFPNPPTHLPTRALGIHIQHRNESAVIHQCTLATRIKELMPCADAVCCACAVPVLCLFCACGAGVL